MAAALGAHEHRVMGVDLAGIGGSALDRSGAAVPESPATGIPVTYVPARNTLLLSLALGWAEVARRPRHLRGSQRGRLFRVSRLPARIHRGVRALARLATKAGVEGARLKIHAPLIRHVEGRDHPRRAPSRRGLFGMTVSCYQARRGPGLRTMRFVPLAGGWFCGGGSRGPDALSLSPKGGAGAPAYLE